MIKKILLVSAFTLILQFMAGCVDCICGPVKDIYFTHKGFSVNNIDASLPEPRISNTGVISSSNYGIQIRLQNENIAARKSSLNWGLISKAQACDCVVGDLIGKEDIAAIEVFSNNDFDANHPKNTDISLYFKVKHYGKMVPIAEYLKFLKETNQTSSIPFYWGAFLEVAPSISKKHKFRIKMTLSDSRVLEAETTEIELS
jgi:hypothetical protein